MFLINPNLGMKPISGHSAVWSHVTGESTVRNLIHKFFLIIFFITITNFLKKFNYKQRKGFFLSRNIFQVENRDKRKYFLELNKFKN